MEKIIIDATNAILGRLCSFAAKESLEGKEVKIINCEKAIISGNRLNIIERYKKLKSKGGHALRGPNISGASYKQIKRCIRGMLPDYRKGIGKQAFSNIKCYNGIPKEFEKINPIKMENRIPDKRIKLEELSKRI